MAVVIGTLFVIWLAFRQWKRPQWLGSNPTKMTDEEVRTYKKDMKIYLRKFPNSPARKYNPEIIDEMKAIERYRELEKEFEMGKIDQVDFQIRAIPLLEKINVDDL